MPIDDPVSTVAVAIALGVGAQWLAAKARLPAIVMMLGAGLIVGPWLGVLDPDAVFGGLLSPFVALGVGILLFEGGLSLRWNEIGDTTRQTVARLLSIGVVVSFIGATTAALLLTDLPRGVAVLFGSIMVVTGPTVVIPLLRQARLRPRVGSILRWEGIIVDPIGAVLGVSVLEVLLLDDGTPGEALIALLQTTLIGCSVGLLAALALVVVLDRHWVPDHLRDPLALATAVGCFAAANELGTDAGLYAVTVLGIAVANQRRVPTHSMLEFHEHLTSIILAAIFVVLAARVEPDVLRANLLPALALLAVLVLLVRPAAVFASTMRTTLTKREKLYLAALAPRGIVAASVSAVFGAELTHAKMAGGEDLAAITFLVVAGTTLVYGPLARPLARRLQVDVPEPKAVALVGAGRWVRALGTALGDQGIGVLVVAESPPAADQARSEGLLVYGGRLGGDELVSALDGVGARLAVVSTGAEALEAFGSEVVVKALGRSNLWRVALDDRHRDLLHGKAWDGRLAFGGITHERLDRALADGASVLALEEGQPAGAEDLALMVIGADGIPSVVSADRVPEADERLVVVSGGANWPEELEAAATARSSVAQ